MDKQRQTISQFRGEYGFLSNFHPAKVMLDGEEYLTVEHAYQAAKTADLVYRKAIQMEPSPGRARALGRSSLITPRPDWDDVRVDIMYALLRQKFSIPALTEKLLATGDAYLVEGNDWGDTFWGAVNGKGENVLGTLLFVVRSELRLREG